MSDPISPLNAALEGRYRIERELGEGGMATVYLARDEKHNRSVALKVLKPELAAVVGSERFLAEIETTANLQHPHILPLFDSGEANGFLYYVMPYVEGESLRDRLQREKQLPVDEAVRIAADVAEALHSAHEQGVIHRDVKPANILLGKGRPLVADFGIALAVSQAGGGRLTETGLSMGTPYYMSPEQATGDREITAASDVYALGCVLYEMLVGEPPYMGATAQAVLGKILTEKPRHPTAVRAMVPANVEGAVLRALEKLPADRFRSASGFVRAMTDSSFRYGAASATGAEAASDSRPWKRATLALGALSVVFLGGWLWSALAASRVPRPAPVVLALETPEGEDVSNVAVSRDGSMFAISTGFGSDASRIWMRRADEAHFRPVPGTEGAAWGVDFSPDGVWLVFRHDARDALLKVALSGGGALPILEVDSLHPVAPHWGDDGTIAFLSRGEPWRVHETGEGGAHRLPGGISANLIRVLPDGSAALADDYAGGIYLIDFEADSARLLVPGGRAPVYVETGHLLYTPESGGLFAVPFDLRRREVTGQPTPVLDGVSQSLRIFYDVSRTGTLVYLQGQGLTRRGPPQRRLLFLDREGRADTVRLTPRPIYTPALSPDGRYIAYSTLGAGSQGDQQIQVLDLVTGSTPEVTSEGESRNPVWSPDGTRIAVAGVRDGDADVDLYVISLDGGEAERRLALAGYQSPVAWSAQDEIVFESFSSSGNSDLGIMPLSDGAQPRPYLEADYSEGNLAISPDGTLAAYVSWETGTSEVFVRGFPDPVGKWNVSVGPGSRPTWSPDGTELYFWRITPGVDSLFAVPLRRDADFVPGPPTFLVAAENSGLSTGVHPDGRFLVAENIDPAFNAFRDPSSLRWLVVLNWFTTLEERLGR